MPPALVEPAAATISAPVSAHAEPEVPAIPGATRSYIPPNVKRLARAIFVRNNPVDVASRLLSGEGDATMARTFTLLMEYLYGKPLTQLDSGGPEDDRVIYQFVTRAPRPQLPAQAAEPAGDAGAQISNPPTEDEHDGHQ
ncbi:MAG TPA: hypothetical protein VKG84_07135 [Candidatus Acidoferrales bacterium]|nr:hypothetical protein [Candidatus Acidoferrales bacterium]